VNPVDIGRRARSFAAEAYGSDRDLDHPTEVAQLVGSGDQELEAAAILHDLVEDTDIDVPQIEAEFGPRITALVQAMTEDGSIEDYGKRKQEHRIRARDAGRDVALLFTADKLSNARRMRRGEKKTERSKLEHYRRTLETMRAAYPDLPLLDELEKELALTGLLETPLRAPASRPGARA
jgi:(p)ppGpp synthase/HD superfamily hydrolase